MSSATGGSNAFKRVFTKPSTDALPPRLLFDWELDKVAAEERAKRTRKKKLKKVEEKPTTSRPNTSQAINTDSQQIDKPNAVSPRVATAPAPGTTAIPYHLDGNPLYYTPKNMAHRQRLRNHPDIIKAIDQFWMTYERDPLYDTISMAQYVNVYLKMVKALYRDFQHKSVYQAALDDWNHDTRGGRYQDLHQEAYRDSMFQLADTWSDSLHPDRYVDFLNKLYQRISTSVKELPKRWKDLKTITTMKSSKSDGPNWGGALDVALEKAKDLAYDRTIVQTHEPRVFKRNPGKKKDVDKSPPEKKKIEVEVPQPKKKKQKKKEAIDGSKSGKIGKRSEKYKEVKARPPPPAKSHMTHHEVKPTAPQQHLGNAANFIMAGGFVGGLFPNWKAKAPKHAKKRVQQKFDHLHQHTPPNTHPKHGVKVDQRIVEMLTRPPTPGDPPEPANKITCLEDLYRADDMGEPTLKETGEECQVVHIQLPGILKALNGFYFVTEQETGRPKAGKVYKRDDNTLLMKHEDDWVITVDGKIVHVLGGDQPGEVKQPEPEVVKKIDPALETSDIPPSLEGVAVSLMCLVADCDDSSWNGYYFPAGDTCEGALRYQRNGGEQWMFRMGGVWCVSDRAKKVYYAAKAEGGPVPPSVGWQRVRGGLTAKDAPELANAIANLFGMAALKPAHLQDQEPSSPTSTEASSERDAPPKENKVPDFIAKLDTPIEKNVRAKRWKGGSFGAGGVTNGEGGCQIVEAHESFIVRNQEDEAPAPVVDDRRALKRFVDISPSLKLFFQGSAEAKSLLTDKKVEPTRRKTPMYSVNSLSHPKFDTMMPVNDPMYEAKTVMYYKFTPDIVFVDGEPLPAHGDVDMTKALEDDKILTGVKLEKPEPNYYSKTVPLPKKKNRVKEKHDKEGNNDHLKLQWTDFKNVSADPWKDEDEEQNVNPGSTFLTQATLSGVFLERDEEGMFQEKKFDDIKDKLPKQGKWLKYDAGGDLVVAARPPSQEQSEQPLKKTFTQGVLLRQPASRSGKPPTYWIAAPMSRTSIAGPGAVPINLENAVVPLFTGGQSDPARDPTRAKALPASFAVLHSEQRKVAPKSPPPKVPTFFRPIKAQEEAQKLVPTDPLQQVVSFFNRPWTQPLPMKGISDLHFSQKEVGEKPTNNIIIEFEEKKEKNPEDESSLRGLTEDEQKVWDSIFSSQHTEALMQNLVKRVDLGDQSAPDFHCVSSTLSRLFAKRTSTKTVFDDDDDDTLNQGMAAFNIKYARPVSADPDHEPHFDDTGNEDSDPFQEQKKQLRKLTYGERYAIGQSITTWRKDRQLETLAAQQAEMDRCREFAERQLMAEHDELKEQVEEFLVAEKESKKLSEEIFQEIEDARRNWHMKYKKKAKPKRKKLGTIQIDDRLDAAFENSLPPRRAGTAASGNRSPFQVAQQTGTFSRTKEKPVAIATEDEEDVWVDMQPVNTLIGDKALVHKHTHNRPLDVDEVVTCESRPSSSSKQSKKTRQSKKSKKSTSRELIFAQEEKRRRQQQAARARQQAKSKGHRHSTPSTVDDSAKETGKERDKGDSKPSDNDSGDANANTDHDTNGAKTPSKANAKPNPKLSRDSPTSPASPASPTAGALGLWEGCPNSPNTGPASPKMLNTGTKVKKDAYGTFARPWTGATSIGTAVGAASPDWVEPEDPSPRLSPHVTPATTPRSGDEEDIPAVPKKKRTKSAKKKRTFGFAPRAATTSQINKPTSKKSPFKQRVPSALEVDDSASQVPNSSTRSQSRASRKRRTSPDDAHHSGPSIPPAPHRAHSPSLRMGRLPSMVAPLMSSALPILDVVPPSAPTTDIMETMPPPTNFVQNTRTVTARSTNRQSSPSSVHSSVPSSPKLNSSSLEKGSGQNLEPIQQNSPKPKLMNLSKSAPDLRKSAPSFMRKSAPSFMHSDVSSSKPTVLTKSTLFDGGLEPDKIEYSSLLSEYLENASLDDYDSIVMKSTERLKHLDQHYEAVPFFPKKVNRVDMAKMAPLRQQTAPMHRHLHTRLGFKSADGGNQFQRLRKKSEDNYKQVAKLPEARPRVRTAGDAIAARSGGYSLSRQRERKAAASATTKQRYVFKSDRTKTART